MTLSELNDIVKSVDGTHWHIDVEVVGKAVGISYAFMINITFEGCFFVVWLKDKDGITKIDNIYEFIRGFNRVVAETHISPFAADELMIIKERLKHILLVEQLVDICCPNEEGEET